ncbi:MULTISPECIES: serine hydrolase [Proteus]|jgi:D-alanyl-D-alanine carboxypeptidase (penicillin-binding protein 5/6)|uniref:serine-type D-Ala-D-Ala carboxypeptidase n=1 Tax=Proteus vulgaris TaxID=585 RepID=A0A379F585_PROVU|nr:MULTISPECIES: serine hydrolase [Proteus]NBN61449.1 serine-type D-Ala-D-Ala carboxypeptidase [Proteus sp. G2639]RNT26696.1 serine-type D-Ala-D-Ala carboxypeptidase [Proteus mirabilis]AYY79996.1 serine-type D-Ala-D-Ala carboxypeptidase [Proteus vulgaris]KGA60370.1 D-alanyl-D-alanine carboxypeptidase dacC [Proteus vulgaris]MBG5971019.1 serine hydrolase [Proteus vulgaris]
MKKNIPSVLGKVTAGMGLLLIISSPSFAVNNPVPPQIEAKSYVLMDYNSGKILASEKPDERLDPASLTKIMSSYVVGQAIKEGRMSPDDMVIVGRNAWATGNPVLKGSSLMFLKPGDQVKVIDLNRGMVIQSGNDASIALAEHVAGSQETFVDLMNSYANNLGLKNTHFKTVHGLDSDGQYTTAQDMALLTAAMIRDVPSEYEIHKEKEFTFNNIRQPNRNRLLWNKNMNVDGVKTGHTNGAGYNLVSSATEGNMRLIAVVLGAPSDKIRFAESEKLLGWGFRFFETVTPVKENAPLTKQKVWYGDKGEVALGVANDASITIPKGELKNLKASFTLTNPVLEAPLTQNQVVGTVNFLLNDEVIEQRPLVVKEAVEEGGFFSRIWDFVVKTVSGWFNAIFG